MKTKVLLSTLAMLLVSLTMNAQAYKNSRYYNPSSGRLDYSQTYSRGNRDFYGNVRTGCFRMSPYCYYGFRVGPSFSTVLSDDATERASTSRTGVNVGVTAGYAVSHRAPVYFETGLNYTQKGGRTNGIARLAYNLDYLEVPLTLKYIYAPTGHFSVQPFLGGYLACGVNGKVKDADMMTTSPAFGDSGYAPFKRFDGGLKMGCGISYDVFYAELAYECGLANISKNDFGSTRNSSIQLNFGLNF